MARHSTCNEFYLQYDEFNVSRSAASQRLWGRKKSAIASQKMQVAGSLHEFSVCKLPGAGQGSLIAQLNISTWHLKAALESSSACANTSAGPDTNTHASSSQEFPQLPLCFDALALQALG